MIDNLYNAIHITKDNYFITGMNEEINSILDMFNREDVDQCRWAMIITKQICDLIKDIEVESSYITELIVLGYINKLVSNNDLMQWLGLGLTTSMDYKFTIGYHHVMYPCMGSVRSNHDDWISKIYNRIINE